MYHYMVIILFLLFTTSCNDNSSELSSFAAIFNPPPLKELKQNMFEKTVDFEKRVQKHHADRMQVFDKSLAKFNQAVTNGDKRYQAGVVFLTDYDVDKEIFYFEIKKQAKWVKQFFSYFPYEKQKWIGIAPEKAKALWEAGKEKHFFILVNRLDDGSIINNAIVRGEKRVWVFGLLIPELVFIPAGSFRMGGNKVSMKSFYMGKYEVTFAEYDQFAEATGRDKPDDRGWGRGNRPVIKVSWHDATAYAKWLSEQTGGTYRLPTEAEWEYAARADTSSKYWWGNEIGSNNANCDGSCGDSFEYTSPVGSFSANPFGLHDTAGNVWEWTCSEFKQRSDTKKTQCVTSPDVLSIRGVAVRQEALALRLWPRWRDFDVPQQHHGLPGVQAITISTLSLLPFSLFYSFYFKKVQGALFWSSKQSFIKSKLRFGLQFVEIYSLL